MGTILTKTTRLDASNDLMLVDDSGSTSPPSYDVQDFMRTSSDDIVGLEVLYELLPDGSRRTSGGHHEKQCLTLAMLKAETLHWSITREGDDVSLRSTQVCWMLKGVLKLRPLMVYVKLHRGHLELRISPGGHIYPI